MRCPPGAPQSTPYSPLHRRMDPPGNSAQSALLGRYTVGPHSQMDHEDSRVAHYVGLCTWVAAHSRTLIKITQQDLKLCRSWVQSCAHSRTPHQVGAVDEGLCIVGPHPLSHEPRRASSEADAHTQAIHTVGSCSPPPTSHWLPAYPQAACRPGPRESRSHAARIGPSWLPPSHLHLNRSPNNSIH